MRLFIFVYDTNVTVFVGLFVCVCCSLFPYIERTNASSDSSTTRLHIGDRGAQVGHADHSRLDNDQNHRGKVQSAIARDNARDIHVRLGR